MSRFFKVVIVVVFLFVPVGVSAQDEFLRGDVDGNGRVEPLVDGYAILAFAFLDVVAHLPQKRSETIAVADGFDPHPLSARDDVRHVHCGLNVHLPPERADHGLGDIGDDRVATGRARHQLESTGRIE